MYTVKSPAEGYSGTSAGVKFTGGVGKTDNPNAAEWLKRHGYEVTDDKSAKPDKAPGSKAPEPAKEPDPPKPKADSKKGGKA